MNKRDYDYQFGQQRLDPYVLCAVGPNGSGKSSVIAALGISDDRLDDNGSSQNFLKHILPFINPDHYSAQIRERHPEVTQKEADKQAATLAENHRRELANLRANFGFETVGSHASKVDFLQELKANGYFVAIIFVGTESPEINKARIACRVARGGHDVDPEKVEPRYYRTMGLLPQYFNVADYIAIYDNSSDNPIGGKNGPRLLLTKTVDGSVRTTKEYEKVPWLRKYLPEHFPEPNTEA